MHTFDGFAQDLREALTHLYDPAYRPPDGLITILAHSQPLPPGTVQQMVISAIQGLQPDPSVPPTARSRRLYELLVCRYVQELTQEETAERLGITPRHLRREQQQAVQMLAQWLWSSRAAGDVMASPALASSMDDDQAERDWRSQVHQELAVLEASEPGVLSDVGAVVTAVVEKTVWADGGLARRQPTRLFAQPVDAGIEAAIHPAVLRQILIVAIRKLSQAAPTAQIVVSVTAHAADCELVVAGAPVAPDVQIASQFIGESATAHGGKCSVERRDETAQFRIVLPRAQPVNLLVADDNADIVHVYRRYLERTRFRVVHAAGGQAVFAALAAQRPDIVLLDVMLPDMDGWEVLTRLHEDPATRDLPVIICSVIRQEELALALGAVRYVPKPVRRPDLIQALEQALAQGSRAAPTTPANTAEAY